MKNKKQNFFVGKIQDFDSLRGYFVGHFMKEKGFPLFQSDKVEVAWKKFPAGPIENAIRHTHKKGFEVNVVISGWIRVEINGEKFTVKRGEFYVIHPHSVTKDLEVGENTEMIIVKAPSVPGDKYPVEL